MIDYDILYDILDKPSPRGAIYEADSADDYVLVMPLLRDLSD